MMNSDRSPLSFLPPGHRSLGLILALILIGLAAAACGSSDGAASTGAAAPQNVIDNGRTLTLDDLVGVGFKKGKSFNVEGLPAATEAYYGFWGTDPYNRGEFEARFYATHADAVAFGTAPARERTGRDAILKADQASWDEGLKEARACTRSAGGDSSNCKVSRYGDYVIFGNLVLLCQGRDQASGRESCDQLLAGLQ